MQIMCNGGHYRALDAGRKRLFDSLTKNNNTTPNNNVRRIFI